MNLFILIEYVAKTVIVAAIVVEIMGGGKTVPKKSSNPLGDKEKLNIKPLDDKGRLNNKSTNDYKDIIVLNKEITSKKPYKIGNGDHKSVDLKISNNNEDNNNKDNDNEDNKYTRIETKITNNKLKREEEEETLRKGIEKEKKKELENKKKKNEEERNKKLEKERKAKEEKERKEREENERKRKELEEKKKKEEEERKKKEEEKKKLEEAKKKLKEEKKRLENERKENERKEKEEQTINFIKQNIEKYLNKRRDGYTYEESKLFKFLRSTRWRCGYYNNTFTIECGNTITVTITNGNINDLAEKVIKNEYYDIDISICLSLIDTDKKSHAIQIQDNYTLEDLNSSLDVFYYKKNFRHNNVDHLCVRYTYPKDEKISFRCYVNLQNGILYKESSPQHFEEGGSDFFGRVQLGSERRDNTIGPYFRSKKYYLDPPHPSTQNRFECEKSEIYNKWYVAFNEPIFKSGWFTKNILSLTLDKDEENSDESDE